MINGKTPCLDKIRGHVNLNEICDYDSITQMIKSFRVDNYDDLYAQYIAYTYTINLDCNVNLFNFKKLANVIKNYINLLENIDGTMNSNVNKVFIEVSQSFFFKRNVDTLQNRFNSSTYIALLFCMTYFIVNDCKAKTRQLNCCFFYEGKRRFKTYLYFYIVLSYEQIKGIKTSEINFVNGDSFCEDIMRYFENDKTARFTLHCDQYETFIRI